MRRTGESDEGIVEDRTDETFEKNSAYFDVIEMEAFDFFKEFDFGCKLFQDTFLLFDEGELRI